MQRVIVLGPAAVISGHQDVPLEVDGKSKRRGKSNAIEILVVVRYRLEISGEQEKQKHGFRQLGIVLLISSAAIFLALAFQFKSAIKPFIVFAAVPFGAVGALIARWIMRAPFGLMRSSEWSAWSA